jgi:D-beta-D-heptose 7-phosphate kinase/D-beta-D-heptose 1-phosphate adenosyltransferase
MSTAVIAVIGDVMLDHFVVGHVDRISPEAPVPVVRFQRDDYRLGGAANVAANVRALGAIARLVGVVGIDDAAAVFRHLLRERDIADTLLVPVDGRPTTRKVRVVTTRNQQVARIDYEDASALPAEVTVHVSTQVAHACARASAVVLSDYRKGLLTPAILAATRAAAGRAPIIVDPKVPDARHYAGATVLTPNHHEAELMTGTRISTPDDAKAAARALHAATDANILITWGEHGMWLFDASGPSAVDLHIPASAREVADVTGAGDTVVATLALALAEGATLSDAARLANQAAGIVVGRFGAATVTRDELT